MVESIDSDNERDLYFKDFPTIHVKKEIPINFWILKTPKINLRLLSQSGITDAYVMFRTTKGLRTFVSAEDWDDLKKLSASIIHKLKKKHIPPAQFSLGLITKLAITVKGISSSADGRIQCAPRLTNVREIEAFIDELGLSEVPLMTFGIPLSSASDGWIFFDRVKSGYYCFEVKNKSALELSKEELVALITDYPILQRLNCSVCQQALKTSEYVACLSSKEAS